MEIALTIVVLLLSAFVRSAFGFGDALLAMPLLAPLLGMKLATPLVALVASTCAALILLRNWRGVDVKSAWRLVISSLAGIPLGLYLLAGAHETLLKLILGGVLLVFALWRWFNPEGLRLGGERGAWPFGFAAGILGGAYNTNGPPVVIYGTLRRWPPGAFRATLQGYFMITGFLVLGGHAAAGFWTTEVFRLYLWTLPAVLLAVWIGGKAHRALPPGKFDRVILLLLMAVSVFLIVESVK